MQKAYPKNSNLQAFKSKNHLVGWCIAEQWPCWCLVPLRPQASAIALAHRCSPERLPSASTNVVEFVLQPDALLNQAQQITHWVVAIRWIMRAMSSFGLNLMTSAVTKGVFFNHQKRRCSLNREYSSARALLRLEIGWSPEPREWDHLHYKCSLTSTIRTRSSLQPASEKKSRTATVIKARKNLLGICPPKNLVYLVVESCHQ